MFEMNYVEQAEAELTHAAQRLWELRRLALSGQYDSEEFDSAIATYRAAALAAQEARAAAYQASGGPHAVPSPPPGPLPGWPGAPRGLQVPMVFTRALAAAAAGPETPDTPALREPAEHPAAPFVPTPRMRFVKWLVETGRLSDQ